VLERGPVTVPGRPGERPRKGSGEREIGRAFAAVAAGFDLERHLLSVGKAGQTGAFDGGDVDEDVLAARLVSMKPKPFWVLKNFTVPLAMSVVSCSYAARRMRQPGKVRLRDRLKPDERKQKVAEKNDRLTDMRLPNATCKGCLATSRLFILRPSRSCPPALP
jgi:hypothetical protein